MNPYTKAAQFLIRLVGFGFLIVSIVLLSGNLVLMLADRPTDTSGALALEAMPFLIGAVVLWKSTTLARSLTRDLGEDE